MKYLTLAADYGQLALRDEQAGPLNAADLAIPAELADELERWNRRYQQIIPLGTNERRSGETATLIDELDRDGLELAKRLADAFPEGAKVAYYSEGRLRRLP